MSRKNSLTQKAVRRMLKKMRVDKRYQILGDERKFYSIVLTKNYPKAATSCFKLVQRDKSYHITAEQGTKPLRVR